MRSEDRIRARSFGDDAAQYDRARPSYPQAMVDDLMVARPVWVLDVGCGTGIAGRLFMSRGSHVLGIEPDDRMAQLARLAGEEVEISEFENWDPKGRTFDLLVSGQAWHWVDPDAGASKAAAVLHPGARVGLFWNRGHPEADIGTRFDAIYRDLAPNLAAGSIVLGSMGDDRFEAATAGLEGSGFFERIERRVYSWQHRYTRGMWLDLVPTHSDHRTLPPEQLAQILTAVGEAIDARGGSLIVDYDTVLVTGTRRQDGNAS